MFYTCQRVFELALEAHLKVRPIKGHSKIKAKPHRLLPAWQRDLALAVEEMEGYTLEQDSDVEDEELE